jgi:heterodisulfide reductase subunit C
MISQILFAILLGIMAFLIWKRIRFISGNIKMGRDIRIDDHKELRLQNMIRMALGQKKMFDRPLVGIMHMVIYVGFFLVNIEVLEIVLDGLTGQHRIFQPLLGGLYPALIGFFEFLAVGVLLVCVVFLLRRNMAGIARFQSSDLNNFPRLDANLILFAEIALMLALLNMNAIDAVLQTRGTEHYTQTGPFFFSGPLMSLYTNMDSGVLVALERGLWWFHIAGILGFGVYVTYSKHLHIALAFPNTYYARLNQKGEIRNMDAVTTEVKIALGLAQDNGTPPATGSFGAKDVTDLTWKHLMDAYSCSECGRCTSECPANLTGKKLSPRKIMMATRDRMEDIGNAKAANPDWKGDGKSLLGDYISQEEILACTSCNACVEACPIQINPLDIIVELRRYSIMEATQAPASWNSMFSNLENNGAPWAMPASDRGKWMEKAEG